jgi:hypothetical protein
MALLRYTYVDSFFLEPEDIIRELAMGATWNFAKKIKTGLL